MEVTMRALRYWSDVNTSGGGPEWTRRDDFCVAGAFHLCRVGTYVTCRHDLEVHEARLDGRSSPRKRPCIGRLIMDPWPDHPYHAVQISQHFDGPWPCDGRCRTDDRVVVTGAVLPYVREFLAASGDRRMPAHLWGRRFATGYHGRESHCAEFCVDGRAHVTQRWSEYGWPNGAFEGARPCDGSCRRRSIRLPRQVQRRIERYQSSIARPFAVTDVQPERSGRSSVVRTWTEPPRDARWFERLARWQRLGFGTADAELLHDARVQYGPDAWLEASDGWFAFCTVPISLLGPRARLLGLQQALCWLQWSTRDEEPKVELMLRRPDAFGTDRLWMCRNRFDFINGLWVHPDLVERDPTWPQRIAALLDLAPSVPVQSYVPYGHLTNEEVAPPSRPPNDPIEGNPNGFEDLAVIEDSVVLSRG
ncbi:hypothetical protein HY634_03355 [Candidatus Uhrbacteria bacterium]|nr:hypothetical protein [Candidatus Uhrbacteria bacterium]